MKQTFIAFDFETTGFSPLVAEIIEIGAVKFDAQGKVLGTFEQLVKPGFGINPDAQAVNGISEAMVANCPSLHVVTPRSVLFLAAPGWNILVTHNAANFGIRLLARARLRLKSDLNGARFGMCKSMHATSCEQCKMSMETLPEGCWCATISRKPT